MQEMTTEDIIKMSYTDFIAAIKETNRCPGGKQTIRRIREVIEINKSTKILDVGSNTGFNSLELARITPAQVHGIDISEACVAESKALLMEDVEDISSRVSFQVASAYEIPFPDNEFDVLMVGGATSFMDNKHEAIAEYIRVLKPWGFLVMSPLTYHTSPPLELVNEVSAIISSQIRPMTKEDWIETVNETNGGFELYFQESHSLSSRDKASINEYVDYFLAKEHIKVLSEEVRSAIKDRWMAILEKFNENHRYLGYDILIYRKRFIEEEPELFIGK